MLDGLFMLLSLSVVMAVASFLFGSLPLSFSLSQSHLRLISTIGMGLLVGTSLIVIIPEGIETLYSAGATSHVHNSRAVYDKAMDIRWSAPVEKRSEVVGLSPMIAARISRREDSAEADAINALPGPVIPETASLDPNTDSYVPPKEGEFKIQEDKSSSESSESESSEEPQSPHAYVGLSLILGFILMYLIDQLPRHASGGTTANHQPSYISLDNLSQGPHRSSSPGTGSEAGMMDVHRPRSSRSLATTLGLVIHAAADGIALGASSSTANTSLGIIIFFAIMVHKAPAAFGLTSVLLKQGLTKRQARAHLIIFSLAAPIGAISTWTLVHLLRGDTAGDETSTQWWTGILLLFSAGTFLYVAMHTMQEESDTHQHEGSNGYSDPGARKLAANEGPKMRDTLTAVVGMLLPLLTQVGHVH
ncbi:MAG: hypothetical protein M4579_000015 [Chaenotheca gracillima]|nr:MAG: hypothetical protein M4579_000015 [Chaenotheca gracillima]